MSRPSEPLPSITIITACRNGARFIVEALESARRQQYPALQHLVFDACSTDGTLAILKRYPDISVTSEPDQGVYDAWNRALRRADGDIIGFLNTDDFYPEGVLTEVGALFASDPEVDLVVGGAVMFAHDQNGQCLVLSERSHNKQGGLWLPELTFGVPGINGWFFRRRVFDRIGTFDNDYSLAGDRLFLIALALAGLKARLLGRPGIWYRRHAGSLTINREMTNLRLISRQHFRMALELSRRTGINPYQRRVFLAWHAFEGAKLAVRDALAGNGRDAFGTLRALFRRNPLWPIRLLHGLALRLAVGWLDRHAGKPTHAPIR